jgi:hypothetical protein
MTRFEMILRAFEALIDGEYNRDDLLQVRLMRLLDEAEPDGLAATQWVEALLERELTAEEENLVLLRTESADGRGWPGDSRLFRRRPASSKRVAPKVDTNTSSLA